MTGAADVAVAQVGASVLTHLSHVTALTEASIIERIAELTASDLEPMLHASVESNIKTIGLAFCGEVDVEGVVAPGPATDFAHVLAQRGTSPYALARAYRVGQQAFLDWCLAQLAAMDIVEDVRAVASRRVVDICFFYIDAVSEYVLGDYQEESTHEQIRAALGDLGADDESLDHLRETLLVFLQENGSYLAAAQRLYLHKNTVRYRVEKAIALRGRPVGEDRLDVQLALIAAARPKSRRHADSA